MYSCELGKPIHVPEIGWMKSESRSYNPTYEHLDRVAWGIVGRLMNWWGRKYTNLPGHWRPRFLIPTHPTRVFFAWMILSLAIQDAFMLYQSGVTLRKKLGSWQSIRTVPSLPLLQFIKTEEAIRVITYQHSPSQQLTVRKNWSSMRSKRAHQNKSEKRWVKTPNGII